LLLAPHVACGGAAFTVQISGPLHWSSPDRNSSPSGPQDRHRRGCRPGRVHHVGGV